MPVICLSVAFYVRFHAIAYSLYIAINPVRVALSVSKREPNGVRTSGRLPARQRPLLPQALWQSPARAGIIPLGSLLCEVA
jgi:hypothetical protein